MSLIGCAVRPATPIPSPSFPLCLSLTLALRLSELLTLRAVFHKLKTFHRNHFPVPHLHANFTHALQLQLLPLPLCLSAAAAAVAALFSAALCLGLWLWLPSCHLAQQR